MEEFEGMRPAVLLVSIMLPLLGGSKPIEAGQTATAATQPVTQSPDRVAEAYEQFLLARRLEDDNDADGAVAAYRRAMTLDPGAADIPASLADLYVRLDQVGDAIAAAEQALAVEPGSQEAHRVLGTIYASRASARGRGAGVPRRQDLDLAIQHLERAVARPPGGPRADVNLRAMLARVYYGAGEYDKAIPLLAEVVKEEPAWRDGASLLSEAYAAADRGDEAIAWLEEAALGNPDLYSALAGFYGRAGRWPDAVDAYDRALAASPRAVDLRVRYARALLAAGAASDLSRAGEVLGEAAALRPEDEQILYLLSQAQRRSGQIESAEATARRLIGLNADNARAYASLAEVLEARGRYDDVVDELEPAVARFRRQDDSALAMAMLLPHLGFAYQRTGGSARAVATFEEALALSPGDVSLTAYLVQAHVAAGDHTRALELAREARTEHPDDLGLARLEARALSAGGRDDEAIGVLDSLLRSQGENPEAHVALARAYDDAGRGDRAVSVLQSAVEQFPSLIGLTFELGAALERQSRYVEAEEAFRRVIASDPDHTPALNYLGYMFAERGERLRESVELIKRALAIDPDNGSYLDSLGWAYFRDGQFELAEVHLRRAADQMTTNSVVQDHFGDVLFELDRFEDAIDAWSRALNGDGDDIDSDEVKRKIRSARERLQRQ